jgi:hypothetical protein
MRISLSPGRHKTNPEINYNTNGMDLFPRTMVGVRGLVVGNIPANACEHFGLLGALESEWNLSLITASAPGLPQYAVIRKKQAGVVAGLSTSLDAIIPTGYLARLNWLLQVYKSLDRSTRGDPACLRLAS